MIVPMKKAQIAILGEDRESVLEALQRAGVLMLIKGSDQSSAEDSTHEEALTARAEKSLLLLEQYRDKRAKKTEADRFPEVTYDEFVKENPEHLALLRSIEQADEEMARFKQDDLTLAMELNTLLPWKDLEAAPDQMRRSKSTIYHTGFVPSQKLASWIEEVETHGAAAQAYGIGPDGTAVVLAIYAEDDSDVLDSLRAGGFTEISLPPASVPVSDVIARKTAEKDRIASKIADLETRLRQYSTRRLELELLADRTVSAGERKRSPLQQTPAAVFIEGWVRVDGVERLTQAIRQATDVYDLELLDPIEGEMPPTAVKNNRFVSAFETITDMFSRPSYYEIDPNPVMSVWYWVLFGMMMADFGYGIVMVGLFAFLIKKMRAKGETLKLLKVMMYSGVTTAFWGILFNSYFGASIGFMSWIQILSPMDDALQFLVLSIIVGTVHIFTGLLMRAANNIKKKDYMAVFADTIAWILLISGVGMLFLPATASIGKWVAISGAAIIVLFAGRSVKNPLGRIGLGLYSLYGSTSYLGDIMSYARILALSLSSAVIAYVMNMLAGMIQGSLIGFVMSLFVYLIGHGFNLVMGLLSAYVHTSRLQFIEYFTKFYDGSGYEHKPLSIKLKYIDNVNDQNTNKKLKFGGNNHVQ